jgi:hypothetical protein
MRGLRLLSESQSCEQDHFENESKHSSSRAGKKDRAGHQYRAEGDQNSLSPSEQMPHTDHKGKRHQHFHQAGVVVVVDVTPIDRAMKVWTMDPENFAIGSQLLDERKKGVAGPEKNHHEGEYFASLFLS